MTEIRLYNTLTRQKEVFTPADPGRVTMYVCGPTVYNRAHIGNARAAVVFDVLFRLLRHVYGAEHVVYARNITDIDDKIIAESQRRGVDPQAVAAEFERHYADDMAALGCLPPTLTPHATHHIGDMIAMIAALIAADVAYVAAGEVLFEVARDPGYGRLSGRTLDAMRAGARVAVDAHKRSPHDFVLWKPSKDGEPGWESPWGRGRPGWHIECSAMIDRVLGRTIDIHGGGLDLIFPHHENEIAQSTCAHGGAPLAKLWMHNGFLSMGADKMSKSLGNVVTVAELLTDGWDGEALRLSLLLSHYRQPLAWYQDNLQLTTDTVSSWYRYNPLPEDTSAFQEHLLPILADDINMPRAISLISGFAATVGASESTFISQLTGFMARTPEDWFKRGGRYDRSFSSGEVDHSLNARNAARARKEFAEADRIRDELAAQGIVLEDNPSGTTWRRA